VGRPAVQIENGVAVGNGAPVSTGEPPAAERPSGRRLTTELWLLAVVSAWAFNFSVTKYALTHGFLPLVYTAPSFMLAALIYCGLTLQRERSLRVGRGDLRLLGGAALVGITLNPLAFVYALHFASASMVALLFGIGPVLVALLSHSSGSERLRSRSWLATAIAFGGVALVALGSGGVSGSPWGISLALAAAASWAVYSVAIGSLVQRYSPLRLNAVVFLVGSLPLLVAASPQLAREDWSRVTPLAWLAFFYSLLAAAVFANLIWYRSIRRVGATHAARYTNLQPILAALFAVLVLSEKLGALQIVGGLVIAAGILIARQWRSPALAE
jgi:drug/metabolite transporter (DMT)-like permease